MNKKTRKPLKVLHIASFSGNIGDVANHQGFYRKFNTLTPAIFSQLEIRKFYKNRAEMKFNNDFVKLVNKYDLLVLGGGGFFDLKWDYSHTGTTMDLSDEVINGIKIPVLVNSMGYHEYGDVKKGNLKKFNKFLKLITSNENWLVTVRNDGSFTRLKKRYGIVTNKVYKVPDNGFYFNPGIYDRLNISSKNTKWIGFNITNELFNKKFNKNIDTDYFNRRISKFINSFLQNNKNFNIILFPHAYPDLDTIDRMIFDIEDKYKRERIIVAPLLKDIADTEYLFDLYRICICVVAMRFHGNVCPIGMNIPTIGLAGHEQISSLYDEIGIPGRCVKIDNKNFDRMLKIKLDSSIKNANQIKKTYMNINKKLEKESDIYFHRVRDFIEKKIQ